MPWWSPVRPGQIIKAHLQESGKASIADLHYAYVQAVKQYNQTLSNPRKSGYRAMTYESFRTFVTRARQGGLLEVVGEEERLGSPLVGVRGNQVIPSRLVYLGLTAEGEAEVAGWDNLQKFSSAS